MVAMKRHTLPEMEIPISPIFVRDRSVMITNDTETTLRLRRELMSDSKNNLRNISRIHLGGFVRNKAANKLQRNKDKFTTATNGAAAAE